MESDEELVLRAVGSDLQAAGELVSRYESAVFATAFGILREYHSAEDVTQDSFLAAFRNLHSLRNGNQFGGWLLCITKREAIRSGKSRNRRATLEASDENIDTRLALEDFGFLEEHLDVAVYVAKLPEHERLVVTLKNFEGHSVREIARITGRPIGTVTKRLSRGYARLRKLLKKDVL